MNKKRLSLSPDTLLEKGVLAMPRGIRAIILGASMTGALMGGQVANADDAFSREGGKSEDIFIGDIGDPGNPSDDAIKRVNLSTGAVSVFASTNFPNGLNGVMGIIFNHGDLVASNQNFSDDPSVNGDILRFNGRGTFTNFLVGVKDKGVAFAPQGIVFGGGANEDRHEYQEDHYYVANVIKSGQTCAKVDEGDVREFNEWGAFVRALERTQFKEGFYPRGVVFGPDGMLYVASRGCPTSSDPASSLLGYVLRFNPYTHKLVDVIVTNETVQKQALKFGFHRPEGLVFDDKGYLWVTSFRDTTPAADPSDVNNVDRILKIDVRAKKVVDSLPLSAWGKPRASAQAIIFGPGGKLYIPISGNAPQTTGQLRRCDIYTKSCDTLVKENSEGGGLISPWFPIFRNSDPGTLSYQGR
ncbi:NHL repeat-containing protein [Caballeronia telluris]|uniref:Gluconolactonase n=1 Tax=Caballeronia telluris TaxID=326475 RepID=A0A158KC13_9BURK|nr:hypothetical protein [Caballeronia telluris]SAL78624.1 hypothetical protein AWB66_05882 [Caballeronia telluris]